ncbi:YgfZ/GcvT domain-containing protein [Silvibacterium sp.]|uniref:CAF17-like 4Fe-4S cluster assembly/insertion protein YgfZ n=1 Tax=Silvibacterium sp. TaxID=1964179 RepID=UPI0039E2244F
MSDVVSTSVVAPSVVEPTPLAAAQTPGLARIAYRGAETVLAFAGANSELAALTASAGCYDLGYRSFVRITGEDRVRWLNGMVSNTIVGLTEGRGNYSFLLNAQGRIQGDANIYAFVDHLLLETDRSQQATILGHLDRFIIMDDVELHPATAQTAVGIAGPKAAAVLESLGLTAPTEESSITTARWQEHELLLIRDVSSLAPSVVPRFTLVIAAEAVAALWQALVGSGAEPCGAEAVEKLRILEGAPLYGVDIRDRHLPQETAQTQALNFSKGCYLGQEIVERIRSRASVHRGLRQFQLGASVGSLENGATLPLEAEGAAQNPVGELSSIAEYDLPGFRGTLAIGFVRNEAVERGLQLRTADAQSPGVEVTIVQRRPEIRVDSAGCASPRR